MTENEFTIIVDTREKEPYSFPCQTLRTGLKTGDYSLVGCETRVSVERKRSDELFLCVGRERKRFERELQRLAEFDYSAIIIEGDLQTLTRPSAFSKVSPRAVINSLVSWSVKFNIHVFFCGNRNLARALTYRILEKYWKHRGGENAGQK